MSSSDTPKTVVLKGNLRTSEAVMASGAAIKPGMLVELTSAGTLRKHAGGSEQGSRSAKTFAVEAGLLGKDIDTAYSNGDTVIYQNALPGDWIYAWLATGENIAIGAYLQSDGAGGLELVDSDGAAIAIAREALNNASGSQQRLKVEII